MAIVSLQEIHKSYAERHLLRGVSFAVEEGDRIALVGPNGCGKSTLLRIVAGLLERAVYPEEGLAKLPELERLGILEAAYRNPGVTLYRVRAE